MADILPRTEISSWTLECRVLKSLRMCMIMKGKREDERQSGGIGTLGLDTCDHSRFVNELSRSAHCGRTWAMRARTLSESKGIFGPVGASSLLRLVRWLVLALFRAMEREERLFGLKYHVLRCRATRSSDRDSAHLSPGESSTIALIVV